MPLPLPTQISGAQFLARRSVALLADEPRVGKTGAAIIAADMIFATSILVITTASGRGVWLRGLPAWSVYDRKPQILLPEAPAIKSDCVIVGWSSLANPKVHAALLKRRWDLIIADEDHYAKNFDSKRTQVFYGKLVSDGAVLDQGIAVARRGDAVWSLSGTPLPHSQFDTYPRLRAMSPERLRADPEKGWPDVTKRGDFMHRYCEVRMKVISRFNKIPVIVGSKNLDELRARLAGLWLRRTQAEVGIRTPTYDLLPLIVSERMRREADGNLDQSAILSAAETGGTKELEMHLGPLRRVTGTIKAKAVVEAVKEELENGLDRIVLMYWHKDVGDILKDGLHKFGLVGIDGASTAAARTAAEREFLTGTARVFVGQIQAAGEAIDLSSSAVLWFVESSFTPKDMGQAALRITNHGQKRQPVVKVVTLAGSIDEALQSRLTMLWTAIKEVTAQ